jgi:hypothetical protein
MHPSRVEAEYCDQLWTLQNCDRPPVKNFRWNVRFDLVVNGVKIGFHKVDFVVEYWTVLQPEVHEVKGVQTAVWALKKKLFEALYPAYKYVVIKKQIENKCAWPGTDVSNNKAIETPSSSIIQSRAMLKIKMIKK